MTEAHMRKAILITGGSGFIGSNFVPFFCQKHPEYLVINLDKLTYAGNPDNLKECCDYDNYLFIKGDICDQELLGEIFQQHDIKGVIHFAAESHVDNSITGPRIFIDTNIVGTFNLLQKAYQHWMSAPNVLRSGYEDCRFHHISTDEVYGSLGLEGYFTEQSPYAPNSPYSASKASSDFLVRSFNHTYGLNVTISNCSNNFGPKQHREKLIPKTIYSCLNKDPITIYGTGKNIRDWLYVADHCAAIELIFHQGKTGESYNVGGNNEKDNLTLIRDICRLMDQKHPWEGGRSYQELMTFVPDRAGHDFRYAIDASKLIKDLGFKPAYSYQEALASTVDWYLTNLKL